MTTDVERYIRCFVIAREFLGYYWQHDGDYQETAHLEPNRIRGNITGTN